MFRIIKMSEVALPLAERPAHVSFELVRDVDLFDLSGNRNDVHLSCKWFQENCLRIFWTPRNGGGLWMLTRAKDILKLQHDYEHFGMEGALVPRQKRPFPAPPIDLEPPEHGPGGTGLVIGMASQELPTVRL